MDGELEADEFSAGESTDSCGSSDSDDSDTELLGERTPSPAFTDSSENEFEGFTDAFSPPCARTFPNESISDFLSKWQEGDRPQVKLPFHGKQGLRQYIDLPAQPTPADFVNLYLDNSDFEAMAVETKQICQSLFG